MNSFPNFKSFADFGRWNVGQFTSHHYVNRDELEKTGTFHGDPLEKLKGKPLEEHLQWFFVENRRETRRKSQKPLARGSCPTSWVPRWTTSLLWIFAKFSRGNQRERLVNQFPIQKSPKIEKKKIKKNWRTRWTHSCPWQFFKEKEKSHIASHFTKLCQRKFQDLWWKSRRNKRSSHPC